MSPPKGANLDAMESAGNCFYQSNTFERIPRQATKVLNCYFCFLLAQNEFHSFAKRDRKEKTQAKPPHPLQRGAKAKEQKLKLLLSFVSKREKEKV